MIEFTMSEQPTRRAFTPETASRTLPLVTRIVADIQRVYREREEFGAALADGTLDDVARPDLERQFDRATAELTGFAREIESIGAVLKDAAGGLIDFLGQLDGEDVWLCWQPGESEVAYWHPLHAGFAGRAPLPVGAQP
jgi:hypothetical protein